MNKPPNILFIFSDQHRWSDLGCSGNAEVISPHFDQFARSGLQCQQAISNSPLCVPARGGLLTGRFPLGHGAWANDIGVKQDVESVATVLSGAGYETGYFGKWHLNGVPRRAPVTEGRRLGFKTWKVNNCDHSYMDTGYYDEADQWHKIEGYDAGAYTELAAEFIQEQSASDQPWAAWLAWGPPHDPYQDVPQKYLDLYANKALSLRGNVPEQTVDRADKEVYWSREDVRKNLHGYYAHITALDEQFGRLLAALEATGQRDNTIIVYTSDHGDQLGSQGWSNKQLPYEESIRVPLLVDGPGIAKGQAEGLIGLNDLPVTLLTLIGEQFESADGRDYSAMLRESAQPGAGSIYISDLVACHQSAWRGTEAWRGVRTPQYTYACRASGEPWLLFDNWADPLQCNNLIQHVSHKGVIDQLHQQTAAYAAQFDALLPEGDLMRQFGLVNGWNESQRHFGLPEIDPQT